MSRNTTLTLSPIFSLSCGYVFTFIVMLVLYSLDFYENSDYFQWGPPILFFSHHIESSKVFYSLFLIVFIQQIMTNWIYEVVVPWSINVIQNPSNINLNYSRKLCIFIINANSVFNQLHLAFMVSSITSQISFLFCLVTADIITLTYINWNYIKNKNEPETIVQDNAIQITENVVSNEPQISIR